MIAIIIFPWSNYNVELKPTCNLLICTDHQLSAQCGPVCSLLLKSPEITKLQGSQSSYAHKGFRTMWEVGGGTGINFPTRCLLLSQSIREKYLKDGSTCWICWVSLNGKNCLIFPIIILNHPSCLPNDMSEKKGTNRIYLVGYNFIICILMVFYCQ